MKREDLEQISGIRLMTGIQIKLGEHDELHRVNITEDCILISVTVYSVVETTREVRFNKKGWKIYTLVRTEAKRSDGRDRWRITDISDPLWDEAFEPYVYRMVDKYETQAEITAREAWEKMCHRPGSRSTPMDNLDRQFQGYNYSDPTFFHTQSDKD